MQNLIAETYSYSRTFTQDFLTTNPGIVTVVNVGSEFTQAQSLEANYAVGYSFYLESLVAQIKLPSLPTAEIPGIIPEMTNAEKFLEIERVLAAFPTLSIQIWIDYNYQGWNLEADIPIQNRKGQHYPLPLLKPYLTMGEVKPLSRTAKLGISLGDNGHGLLGIGDVIRIQCDARKEVSLIPKAAENVGQTDSYERVFPANGTSHSISTYRPTRKAIYLRNAGDTKLYFHFGWMSDTATQTPKKKLYLMPGEAWSWENSYFVLNQDLWVEAYPLEDSSDEPVGKIAVFEAY